MALVTDGDDANAYAGVAEATEYHAQRGNAAWAGRGKIASHQR